MNLRSKKPFFFILILQAVLLLVAIINFGICKLNLYSHTLSPTELNAAEAFVNGEQLTITNLNSGAGIVANTPKLALSKGSYIVYLNYYASNPGNTLSISSGTLAPQHLRSTQATLSPHVQSAVLTFHVGRNAEDLVLNLHFQGQGTFEILGLSIHQTTDSAKASLLYTLLLCLVLSLGYYIYTSPLEKRRISFCLILITLFASYPLFLDYLVVGHDLPFHLLRIDAIKAGLEQGIFPVKIHPNLANDYGYATGVFYGDILLYFPAFLRMLGLSVQSAYQCFVFAMNLATALISYYCFKKLFSGEKAGLLGSMLYTLSMYRLLNVYTRAAVGEYCAMTFLPVIFLGLYQIFTMKDAKCWWKYTILPALGLTGIIQSHILSCEMTALFILLTCIIFIKRTFKPHIFLTLFSTVILTLLLNAGFLVPFMDYYFTEDFIINSDQWSTASVQNMGLFLTQIFSIFPNGTGGTWSTASGVANEFDPAIGLPLLLGFLLFAYYLVTASKEEKPGKGFHIALLSFLYGIGALFLSTYFFPYDALAETGGLGRALVSSLQFPWRFISLATLFLTICTCFSLKHGFKLLLSRYNQSENALNLTRTVSVLVISLAVVLSSAWYYQNYLSTGNPYRVYDTYELPSTQLYTCEYMPAGTILNDIVENRYASSDSVIITEIQKFGTSLTCQVANTGEDGYAEFPLTLYKGYVAKHVESGEALNISAGYNNCLRVEIPTGFIGSLQISFREPLYWRIAEILSALTLLCLMTVWAINYFKKNFRKVA